MRRHPLDPFSLVFGLTFLVLGGLLLDTDVDVADLVARGWLPLPIVFAGVVLLAFGLNRMRSGPRAERDDGTEPSESRDLTGPS